MWGLLESGRTPFREISHGVLARRETSLRKLVCQSRTPKGALGSLSALRYCDSGAGVNHPPAEQVGWGLRPHRGLTVLQKPLNFTGRDKGKAFPLPPPEEAASALVNP